MYLYALTSTLLLFLSTLPTTVASSRSVATAPRQYQARDALAYLESETNMLYRRDRGDRGSSKKICDLSNAAMRDAPTPLPAPTDGLSVSQVTLGRGTQNYTCASDTAADKPKAIGAVATLFNVTCIAGNFPYLLNAMTRISLNYPLPTGDRGNARSNKFIGGNHFFRDSTPIFDLNTANRQLGVVAVEKIDAQPAPEDAVDGQYGDGFGAVKWLKLAAASDTEENDWQEVYRIETAGGKPPATCQDQPPTFEIEYAAQYWFFN